MSVFKESKSYRPFTYGWAVEDAKKHSIDMAWDVHQVELQDDLRQYNTKGGLATKDVSHETNKFIVDKILCLFTEMDKTVAAGYIELLPYIKNNEIRTWFLTAAQREVVHQRAYALLAETFGFTDKDWSSFADYAEMREKLDIMIASNLEGRDEYKAAVILATILLSEGIGLFAAFSCLLNYKRQGLFMGFNDVNQWSLSDEQHHVDTNIKILTEMCKDLTKEENESLIKLIKLTVKRLVSAEHKFIDLVYKMGNQQNLTKEDLKDYISYLGEFRSYQLGLLYVGKVRENPLDWMGWMLTGSKHDAFFEKRVTEYVHRKLSGSVDYDRYNT